MLPIMKIIAMLLPAFIAVRSLHAQALPACMANVRLGIYDKVKVATYKGDTCYVVERNAPYPPGTTRHQILMADVEKQKPGYILPEVYGGHCQPLRFIKNKDLVYTAIVLSKKEVEAAGPAIAGPQLFYVRTISGLGIVPTSTLSVTDSKGRSMSCSYKRSATRQASNACTVDTLIGKLLACHHCPAVMSARQQAALDSAWQQLSGLPLTRSGAGYGQAVYSVYKKEGEAAAVLLKTFTGGGAASETDNNRINHLVRLLYEPSTIQ